MTDNADADITSVPDPDEDDLDDLDDVLDRFQQSKLDASNPSQAKEPAAKITDQLPSASATEQHDFADELRAGMTELLGSIEDNPEMQAEFEKLMQGLDNTVVQEGLQTAAGSTKQSGPKHAPANFQETIKKTMERMKSSGDTASAAAAQSSDDDMLAKMLKEMENGNFPGMNGGTEEDFNKMLLGMMEQLTSKEVLYDPMKELHTKFPVWLEKNAATTTPEDVARYKQQQGLVAEIVTRFDRPGYSDDNQQDKDYIAERMQKMQAAGSPPPDLVGDMGAAQELMSDMDGGCPQQ